MVSYADMITILMAFFVVMYSMAGPKDVEKEEAVLKSLRCSLGRWPMLPEGLWIQKDSRLTALASLGRSDGTGTTSDPESPPSTRGGLPRIQAQAPKDLTPLGEAVYFDEGAAALSDQGQRRLRVIAEALAGKPQRIEVRAYATRRPLPDGSPHRDAWDLAYQRARQTMEFLMEVGIDPRRIRLGVAVGQGADDPLLTTKDARVEVFLLNEFVEQTTGAALTAARTIRNRRGDQTDQQGHQYGDRDRLALTGRLDAIERKRQAAWRKPTGK